MPRKRAHIGLRTKLCSALCAMLRHDGETNKMVPVIPYDEAKRLSEEQILARFRFDHYPIPWAEDGPDVHWNLVPLPAAEHDQKTAKVDIPGIAKRKRLSEEQEEFRRTVLARPCGQKRQRTGKIKGRGFPKRKKTPHRRSQSHEK